MLHLEEQEERGTRGAQGH